MTPSPSRKSKRLLKQSRLQKRLLISSVKRKSERVEKQSMPSPLRRSDRAKKQQSPSSSEIKKSNQIPGSSDMNLKKEKREKSVRQLTLEAREVDKSENPKTVQLKDARSYKALFIRQKHKANAADPGEELKQPNKLPQRDSIHSGGSVSKQVEGGGHVYKERRGEELRECQSCERSLEGSISICRSSEKKALQNHGGLDFSHLSRKEASSEDDDGLRIPRSGDNHDGRVGNKTVYDAEMVEEDCSTLEKLPVRELVDLTSKETLLDEDIDLGGDDKVIPLKRKRNTVKLESDASAMVACKDFCTCVTGYVSLSSLACKRIRFSETCVTCCKRQRLDYGSPEEELCSCNAKLNKELCSTFTSMDRGEIEANVSTGRIEECNKNMQRKKSPEDIPIDGNQNACVVCNFGGKLLCCDGSGCKRSYHLSCLDPPLEEVPSGVWHCLFCVKKKVESGVQSVSEGIESIWNAREVEVLNVEGLQRQKQYFVKYKGLAHFHNQWIPESQLLLEAPLLIDKFNRDKQVTRWKLEWTMPHRFLQKRLSMPSKQYDKHFGEVSDCRYEWLVKWCGLDYEDATWELENAPFFSSSEAQKLIKEYDNRRENSKKEILGMKTGSLIKLSKLPVGGLPGSYINLLNSVNNLREYWHKGRNAVVFNEQERVIKVILFILSLQSDVCRPFLIIAAPFALSLWESEFSSLAASVNVIVYNGSRDTRRRIRKLEFYEEGGCTMFQVLLSPIEAIVEDLEVLKCIRWEAIIIDECQRSRIPCVEQVKMLATEFRLILVSGQIKDSTVDYLDLLSLLETGCDIDSSGGRTISSTDNIDKLKERLSRHIAYECKSESSRFVEYWVPVQITSVQLELYCATLLSNMLSLCSCTKNDPVGVLSDILTSMRKCCDHPYLVDPSLIKLMTKDLPVIEYVDVGIKVSGKLQLLDKMLIEIKNQGLRVLILYQSIGGSGKDTLGDILEDFLGQRFGLDSYEHIIGCASKKKVALNKFNKKESVRFVFLLETRACLPSIKLSSVDTIILVNSDWNPMNDLRALQKISIDSQFEQIKVFRLYSVCTVEEKALILGKEDVTLDNNPQNINRIISHTLLMWGASYLFSKLDELHRSKAPISSANMLLEQSFLIDVVQEFMNILSQVGEKMDIGNSSKISKVQQNGGTYSRKISLLGELDIQLMNDELPHVFWTKLLGERRPQWKYISGSSQRNRKRVQYNDDRPNKSEIESDEAVKKRRKVVNNSTDPVSIKPSFLEGKVFVVEEEGATGISANTMSQPLPRSTACMDDTIHGIHVSTTPLSGNDISAEPEVYLVDSEDRRNVRNAQKSLYLLLRPEMSKLCEILQLKEDVKDMVGRLLEYIMDNHHVSREPVTIFQAFQLSLCWIAASWLKLKLDHKESLVLAKQHLNFVCREEEVDNVYSRLCLLKEIFLNHTGATKATRYLINPTSAIEDTAKDHLLARVSQSTSSKQQKENLSVEERSLIQECADKQVLSPLRMTEKTTLNTIRKIKKRCRKQMANLLREQQEEIQEFQRVCENEKAQMEKEHQVDLAFVRSIHGHNPSRVDKLKILEDEFAKKLEDHKCQMGIRLKKLEVLQLDARKKENEKKDRWLGELTSWAQAEFAGEMSLIESACSEEKLRTSEQVRPYGGSRNMASTFAHCSEKQHINGNVQSLTEGVVGPSGISRTISSEATSSSPIKAATPSMELNTKIDEFGTMSTETALATRLEQHNKAGISTDGLENVISVIVPSFKEQIPDRMIASLLDEEVPLEVSEISPIEVVEGCLSNRESGELDTVESDTPKSTGGSHFDGMGNSMNGDALPPLEVNSPSLLSVIVAPQGDPLPLNQEQQDNYSYPITATDMRDDNAPENSRQNTSQGVPSGQSKQEAVYPEPVVQSDEATSVTNPIVQSNEATSVAEPNMQSYEESVAKLLVQSNEETSRTEPVVQFNKETSVTEPVVESNEGTSVTEPVVQSNQETSVKEPVVQSNHESSVSELDVQQSNHELSVSELDVLQSTDLHIGSENQNTPQVEVPPSNLGDAVLSNQSSQEVPEVHSELSLSIGVSPFVCNQPVPLGNGGEEYDASQNQPEVLVIEPVVQLQQSPSSDVLSYVHNQLVGEGHTSAQNVQLATPPVNNTVELSNQAVSQAATHVLLASVIDTRASLSELPLPDTRSIPSILEFSNRRLQNASTLRFRMSLPLYPDPLQNELERIRKETDQTIKIYEETKTRLKSDYEKEIEEMVAQIRRKYDTKLQEMEAVFVLKKKDLDTNQNKVYMNKMLAEAFRTKCSEAKSSGVLAVQQDMPLSHTQQLVQMSFPESIQRPPLSAGLASVTPPSPHPLVSVGPSQPTTTTLRSSPLGPSPSIGGPGVSQPRPPHVSGPHSNPLTNCPAVQIVRHSSALFSSNSTRPPPIISPITPAVQGNRIGGSEIRAPAPHLQPFRPLTSSLPRQQTPPATTSSPFLHQHPIRPQLLPPVNLSVPYHRGPQHESGKSNPANNNASPQPVLGSVFDMFDVSKFGSVGTSFPANPKPKPNPTPCAADGAVNEADIVCLSDDD